MKTTNNQIPLWQSLELAQQQATSSHAQLSIARALVRELENKLPQTPIDDSIPLTPQAPQNIIFSKRELISTIEGQICALNQHIKCLEDGTTLAHVNSQIAHHANLLQQAQQRLSNIQQQYSTILQSKIKLQFLRIQLQYAMSGFDKTQSHNQAVLKVSVEFQVPIAVIELLVSGE